MEKSEVIAFLESENIKDRDFMDSGMQDYIAEIILKWEVMQARNRMMKPAYEKKVSDLLELDTDNLNSDCIKISETPTYKGVLENGRIKKFPRLKM